MTCPTCSAPGYKDESAPSATAPTKEVPYPFSVYSAEQLTDLFRAIGELSMELGNPAMCADEHTTIEAALLRYAADRHKSPRTETARTRTPIRDLMARYTDENCDFTNMAWVVKAAAVYADRMEDCQVRCLLQAFVDHAQRAQAAPTSGPSEEDVLGALARGYCSPENSGKEVDVALINAMAREILRLAGKSDGTHGE